MVAWCVVCGVWNLVIGLGGGWCVMFSVRCLVIGEWCVVCGVRCVVRGVWCVVRGVEWNGVGWCGVGCGGVGWWCNGVV